MEVAILLAGQLRVGHHSRLLRGIKDIQEILNAKIFLATWDCIGVSDNSRYSLEETDLNSINVNSYVSLVEPTAFEICSESAYLATLSSFQRSLVGVPPKEYSCNKLSSLPQSYIISRCLRLIHSYEQTRGKPFEYVIRLRPDFLIERASLVCDTINALPDRHVLHINESWCYSPNRIYDVMFSGPRDCMEILCNLWQAYEQVYYQDLELRYYRRADMCRMLYCLAYNNRIPLYSFDFVPGDIVRREDIDDDYSALMKRLYDYARPSPFSVFWNKFLHILRNA